MTPFITGVTASGRVDISTDSPVVVSGCQGYDANQRPSVTFAAGVVTSGAATYDATGKLGCYDATGGLPAGAVVVNGWAYTDTGRLCVAGGTPDVVVNEVGAKANGTVCTLSSAIIDFTQASDTLTFGNASLSSTVSANRTIVNSLGRIAQATANTRRVFYNPVTLAVRGTLFEPASTNLCLQSEDLATTWTNTRATVTTNAIAAPTGATTADKLVEDTTASNSHYNQQNFVKAASSLPYVYSIFAKAGERTFFRIQVLDGGANGAFSDVNLSAGTATAASLIGTGFTSLSSAIENYGNGWYRVILRFTSNTATALQVFNVLANSLGGVTYTGDGTSGAYFWGGQLEQAAEETTYIPTTTTSVTGGADVVTLATGTIFSATQGGMLLKYIPSASGTRTIVSITDGTANEVYDLTQSALNPTFTVTDGGVVQASIGTTSVTALATSKSAFRYQANNFQAATNGTLGTADTSGTLPTVTTIYFGSLNGTSQFFRGFLQSASIYTEAPANATLTGNTV